MPSVTPDQMVAAHDLLNKMNAVMHYGEHEGEEVVMTAFVAEIQPRKDPATDLMPARTTELFFVHEDEWVLAEINHIGRSFK